jgi:hypothetical protein
MGTSSARRGPTTGLWRAAKRTATRYLSPEGEGAVTAREVVAKYLAALEETPGQGDRLAVFRFTRKVGQDLGAFWGEINSRGLEKVLQDRGLAPLGHGDAALLASGVSGVMAGSGGGLEEAVVRTALVVSLREAMDSRDKVAPAQLVRQFLAAALSLRLVLDLGEPLEAAAGSYGRLKDGLEQIRQLIENEVPGEDTQPDPPTTSVHWQGLAGWTWVTEMTTVLMARLGQ